MLNYTKQFFLVFACILTFASCSKDNAIPENEAQLKTANLSNSIAYTSLESEILNGVNKYRESIGMKALARVDEVTYQADDHTVYMTSNEVVNHDNFNVRYSNLVSEVGAKAVAENVAFGYGNADAVVKAWIASEGHRVNIEGDFTHFGISVDKDKNGKNYFTNIFMRR
ncbi:CAP domain-containing protein [Gillisia hiemivivida]|uniref:CAP domain-containing protein n=1 Tax=Gillisia hiemivivida TaxID=291190 RepID=A0A5C6ZPY0_9FLAO|nr:CAP domain-containing protein [Gillisia hiemivivida]TXD92304.1 CAP domain-containing protein [Gillisia hiemivivida]